MPLSEGDCAFYAHSLQGHDKQYWQPLAEHLRCGREGEPRRARRKVRASRIATFALEFCSQPWRSIG